MSYDFFIRAVGAGNFIIYTMGITTWCVYIVIANVLSWTSRGI